MLHDLHSDNSPETKGRLIRWASHYDATVMLLTFGRAPAIRKMTAAAADIHPGDSVLDVGCGTGDLTVAARRLAGPSGRVCGIDAAPEMIEVARQKVARSGMEIDFQIGLIEALQFPAGNFDVVLSSLMMHHLPDDVKAQGLREIRRVLKPGGRLVILDFMRPTGHVSSALMTLLLHANMRTGVQDLPDLLDRAGFTRVEVRPTRFWPYGILVGTVAPQPAQGTR